MLGITVKSDLNEALTREIITPIEYVDALNVADVFDSGVIPDEFSVSDIGDGDIVSDMLADAAVTTAKLANLAVDTDKLANLAVEAAKLANSSVEATKIANAAVGSAAIANTAIGTAHIANGAILNAHISDATIQSAKIASLNADVINAGTISGRTLKANNGSGVDVWVENSGFIRFRYGSSNKAYMAADSSGNLYVDSDGDMLLQANNSVFIQYNEDGGSDPFVIFEDENVALILSSGKDLIVEGDIMTNNGTFRSSDGSSGETNSAKGFITSIRANGGNLEAKYREITTKDGLVTDISSETGWQNMGSY